MAESIRSYRSWSQIRYVAKTKLLTPITHESLSLTALAPIVCFLILVGAGMTLHRRGAKVAQRSEWRPLRNLCVLCASAVKRHSKPSELRENDNRISSEVRILEPPPDFSMLPPSYAHLSFSLKWLIEMTRFA